LGNEKGIVMTKNERTGAKVGKIASKGLRNPSALTASEIKILAASALTQRPDHKKPRSAPKRASA
jgi:hypothetical protein